MNLTPGTRKSDHDFVSKSWAKERRSSNMWPRGSCTSIGRVASVVHRKLSLAHAYAFVTERGRTLDSGKRSGEPPLTLTLFGKFKKFLSPDKTFLGMVETAFSTVP